MALALTVLAAVSESAHSECHAQEPADTPTARLRLLVHLPPDGRLDPMARELRLELAGRAELLIPPVTDDAEAVALAVWGAAPTHVASISLDEGPLDHASPDDTRVAEVLVRDVGQDRIARTHTSQPWELVDPRVVAVLVGGMLDELMRPAPAPAPLRSSPQAPSHTTTEANVRSAPDRPRESPDRRRLCTRCERFSFFAGIGAIVKLTDVALLSQEVGFYAQLTHWLALGFRVGMDSIEEVEQWRVGAPSVLASYRIALDRSTALELGAHVEPTLVILMPGSFASNHSLRLGLILSAGAIIGLDIGRHGLRADLTAGALVVGTPASQGFVALAFHYIRRFGST